MKRAACLVALLACAPAAAQHEQHTSPDPATEVAVTFADYSPAHAEVLPGELVRWRNDSARVHTVTADDGSFDSGRLPIGATFTHRFAAEADVPYHCVLHPGVQGTIAVRRLLLDAPPTAAAPGRSFPLQGRSDLPAATTVTLEADTGGGFAPVGAAETGADGRFRGTVTLPTTGMVRAVAGAAVSPSRTLVVLDRSVAARRTKRSIIATVAPAAPGGTVVLQLRLPDRFGWWPVARAKLDARSRARFARPRRRVPARVVLTLPDGATPLALSPVR